MISSSCELDGTLDNIVQKHSLDQRSLPATVAHTKKSQEVESLQDGGQNGEPPFPEDPVNCQRTITGPFVNLDVWKRVFRQTSARSRW